jgi:hypothetical protein
MKKYQTMMIDSICESIFRPSSGVSSEFRKMQDKFCGYKYIHKISFNAVLREIEKKGWTEIDYHKHTMGSCLNKIRHIDWIVVDEDKYNSVYYPKKMNKEPPPSPGLTMSRYSHRTLGNDCYPNSKECIECFKYHCICCGEGTNCMYGGYCSSRRCSNTINRMSFLRESIVVPMRVYVFDYSRDSFHDNLKV